MSMQRRDKWAKVPVLSARTVRYRLNILITHRLHVYLLLVQSELLARVPGSSQPDEQRGHTLPCRRNFTRNEHCLRGRLRFTGRNKSPPGANIRSHTHTRPWVAKVSRKKEGGMNECINISSREGRKKEKRAGKPEV